VPGSPFGLLPRSFAGLFCAPSGFSLPPVRLQFLVYVKGSLVQIFPCSIALTMLGLLRCFSPRLSCVQKSWLEFSLVVFGLARICLMAQSAPNLFLLPLRRPLRSHLSLARVLVALLNPAPDLRGLVNCIQNPPSLLLSDFFVSISFSSITCFFDLARAVASESRRFLPHSSPSSVPVPGSLAN